jgi:hypothetical protein
MTGTAPGATLPPWVAQLRSREQRAAIGIALDVADVALALREANVPAPVRRRLRSIMERADQIGVAVSLRLAGRLLDVSERTARAWVDRGALILVRGTRPAAVSARSLGEALAAATVIRDVGQGEAVLQRVLHALEDQRTRQELENRNQELDGRLALGDELEGLFSETSPPWQARACGKVQRL